MEGFYAMRRELREAFHPLIKNSATEERFIDYIKVSIDKNNKFDIKALEVVLDLSLVVISPDGHINCYNSNNSLTSSSNEGKQEQSKETEDNDQSPQDDKYDGDQADIEDIEIPYSPSQSYDADDEDLEEVFIFPCHLNSDECHPDSLHNYHRDHLRSARTTILLIKYPKLCNFVIEYMFNSIRLQLEILKQQQQYEVTNESFYNYLNSVAILIKRINKVCTIERRNCRILSKINILNLIMNNIMYLLGEIPTKQHIYLEPLLKFAFTLADYKINGSNLKQLFCIIKNEDADLKTVLNLFEQLLNYQFKICKNLQPMKSLNFPTASRTPEEISSDLYILNSWHWRLRSRVIEYKRKISRQSIDGYGLTTSNYYNQHPKILSNSPDYCDTQLIASLRSDYSTATDLKDLSSTPMMITTYDKLTPSWLECSMIAPLSNISPLNHNGDIQFSCSLWMSICGDLLVIEEKEALCRRSAHNHDQEVHLAPNWRNRNGFWLRLISRKRLNKRYTCMNSNQKNKVSKSTNIPKARKRRLSQRLRSILADEKREEEEEESILKLKRSEMDLAQAAMAPFGLRKNFSFSNQSGSRCSPSIKLTKTPTTNQSSTSSSEDRANQQVAKELSTRRAIENDQKLLIHIISFAMDTMTVEIWLNVKTMSFCQRVCRVAREGSTNLICQTEFPSHLEANGSWSHIIFSCNETAKSSISQDRQIHLKLLVDGINEEETKLTYGPHKSPVTNFALLLGCERSTFGYVWKLSQVNIYKNIPTKDIAVFLLGKGPDFKNFTNFQNQQSTLPLPDITQRSARSLLNPKLLKIYGLIDESMCLNWLTQNIVLAYAAYEPDHFLDYSSSIISTSLMNNPSPEHELSNCAERFIQAKVLNFSRSLRFNSNDGFGSALVQAGGIESVLICFTDVIRRAQETSDIHHLAFSILLKMSQTNQHHLNKFIDDLNGLKLVEYILVHPNCIISEQMLDYYLDFCLMRENQHVLIKSSKLMFHLLTCWQAWHKNTAVAKKLYRELIALLEPKEFPLTPHSITRHSYQRDYVHHNFMMLTNAGGIDLLMNILRECLDDTKTKIDHEIVELIVSLISSLIKQTPGLDVMLDIMEFLLFLHPDVKSYVDGTITKPSFLHELNATDLDNAAAYDETDDPRTPSSESYASSLNEPSQNQLIINTNGMGRLDSSRLNFHGSHTTDITSSNDEDAETDNYTSTEGINRRLNGFMNHFPVSSSKKIPKYNGNNVIWRNADDVVDGPTLTSSQPDLKPKTSSSNQSSSSLRDHAIANIVDILANIVVKLTSTDPSRILSEALQKPIIDTRKLIVLANNDSVVVREKVLRLFLRCIRACYNLDLKSVIENYEYDAKGSNFRVCLPIQLMGCQLLKYSTTTKMTELCYGIIVGINESETLKPDCFNIESIDNSLQLNTFILLIHLTSRLENPAEITFWMEFIHSYVKQLIQLKAHKDILSILIKSNLVECLMKLYFSNIKYEIERSKLINEQNLEEAKELADSQNEVFKSLDRTLILVVSYFIKYQTVSESIESLRDLLNYLSLMNSYIISKRFQRILRDRQVKILSTAMGYCKHYERSARSRAYVGKLDYHVKNFFKTTYLNTPPNLLSSSELRLDSFLYEEKLKPGTNDCENLSTSPLDGFAHRYLDADIEKPDFESTEIISGADVKEFYKASLEFVVEFIRSRETDIITSPLEKHFIIRIINLLTNYLNEYYDWSNSRKNIESHWIVLLRDLQEPIRNSFYDLVLYLLSPCKSINIDERKYYASELLEIFSNQEQAFNLLGNEETCKILVHFIKDLINQSDISIYKEDNGQTMDDILENDTENRLKNLARSIEALIPKENEDGLNDVKTGSQYRGLLRRSKSNGSNWNASREILASKWMLELEQKREISLQTIEVLKESRGINVFTAGPMGNLTEINSRLLDEAYNITRDVGEDRNVQRKAYFEDLKQNKVYNYHTRQQWLSLIIGHTHERGTWYMESHYPRSWELNLVEGPSRIRRRLRPCKLTLESRFFRYPFDKDLSLSERMKRGEDMVSSQFDNGDDDDLSSEESLLNKKSVNLTKELEVMLDDWCNLYSPHPLCSMIINHGQSMSSNELRTRKFTTDKIPFNCDCSIIRANEVCEGEILIASWCIHFIGERNDNYQKTLDERLTNHNKSENSQSSNMNRTSNDEEVYQAKSDHGTTTTTSTSIHNKSIYTNRSKFNISRRDLVKQIIVEDLWFDEIVEIWDRRYQLQDVGLEIFLTNNMTYLISFKSSRQRENFKQSLFREQHKMINLQRFNLNTSLNRITQLWRDGKLTNFDYLTCLNKLAGRSFNDLMQYPVFPFILSNYTTSALDLTCPSNFRRLSRPMAVQNLDKEPIFLRNYEDSKSTNISPNLPAMPNEPYHYGNHYSNSATVLHFLVRLPPFTQMLIQYQDNNFDQPDRTFHSLSNLWQLITKDSNTDFKELIPEFFFLPEMFINFENFELGVKQNNELVDNVKMPAWCPNSDSRLFTLIHRQALESAYVSENLHHWIDLIFGYKQTGKAAIDSLNVFHPATYYGMIDLNNEQEDLDPTTAPLKSVVANLSAKSSSASSAYDSLKANNNDATSSSIRFPSNDSDFLLKDIQKKQAKIERKALETMIRTYGQMPRQLFRQPTKQRSFNTFMNEFYKKNQEQSKLSNSHSEDSDDFKRAWKRLEPLKQVRGLKWGSYVGSPDESEIVAVKHKKIISDEQLAQSRRNLKRRHFHFSNSKFDSYANRNQTKFSLNLLPNGEIAILRNNTSLMLDYRADRKSGGSFQFSVPSAKLSRKAGLSTVGRMNLFSTMIISRQQFSYMDISGHVQSDASTLGSSSLVSLTSSKVKFSYDSLSLVSWSYLDGLVRIRNPATNTQKSSMPLVQADSNVDTMTTCASVPELNLLLIGFESGSICAHIVSTTHETIAVSQHQQYSILHNSDSNISSQSTMLRGTSSIDKLSISNMIPTASHSSLNPNSSAQKTHSTSLLTSRNSSSLDVSGMISMEQYAPLSFAGKTLQSVKTIKKTTRWLYCHSKKINCMKINVSFGVVVTGSDDGTTVIWDLNSLTYVRTIDYKLETSSIKKDPIEDKKVTSENIGINGGESVERRRQNGSATMRLNRIGSPVRNNRGQSANNMSSKNQEMFLLDYLCVCDKDTSVSRDRKTSTNVNSLRGSSPNNKKCYICGSGISLITISDTLGDIVTVKDINNRLALASESEPKPTNNDDINDDHSQHQNNYSELDDPSGDETEGKSNEAKRRANTTTTTINGNLARSMSTTSTNQGSEYSDSDSDNLTSVLYAHTINGALIGFVSLHTQVTAVCYSNAPEGVSVNVIVVGLADGLIRLYSSWDLCRVKEFHVAGISIPITSILYSRDNQLLYITYEDGQLVVLRNKKRTSVPLLKEIYL